MNNHLGFKKSTFIVIVVLVAICAFFYHYFLSVPVGYPTGTIVSVEPGENLSRVTVDFRNQRIIRSSTAFQIFSVIFGAERKIIAGDYLLRSSDNVIRLAWRLSRGSFGIPEAKITIPEGYTVAQIGDLLSHKLTDFSAKQFAVDAKNDEGYLFPDTYAFPLSATTSEIVTRMRNNFDAEESSFRTEIAQSGYTEGQVVIMASILEGEATSTHDRQVVAGILWTRIKNGTPLQVDSTLKYITGRGSSSLTAKDLQINSPYNTYRFHGLPPGPIDNPGLDSLKAALNPIQSDYVYFLTGKDGVMHYAKTFAQHQANIQKYL